MFDCLNSAYFSMKFDLQTLAVTQNTVNMQFVKTWTTTEANVPGLVEPLVSVSASKGVSGKRFETLDYTETQYFKLHTNKRLSKRDRITNVRDASGTKIFLEMDANGEPATIFEVVGESPVVDPFGGINHWTYLVNRVEIQ